MISVLMPVSGDISFLGVALDSTWRAASGLSVEVILVVNGVSDPEFELICDITKKYSRDFIRIHRLNDKGIANALNVGLKLCQGEYVARLDADDEMLPDRLFRQVEFLDKNNQVAVVGSFVRELSRDGFPGKIQKFPTTSKEIRDFLCRRNVVNHSSVMMRKSTVLAAGGYREEFEPAEDYELWCRMMRLADINNLPYVLTHYRIHHGQVSFQNYEKQRELAREISSLCQSEQGFGISRVRFISSIQDFQSRSVSKERRFVLFLILAYRSIFCINYSLKLLRLVIRFRFQNASNRGFDGF